MYVIIFSVCLSIIIKPHLRRCPVYSVAELHFPIIRTNTMRTMADNSSRVVVDTSYWSVGETVEIAITDTNLPDFGIIEKINDDGTYNINNIITGGYMKSVHHDLIKGNGTELSSSATSSSSFPRTCGKRSTKKARNCTVNCQVKEILLPTIPCWVTEGKTDHIALLVDQDVLALLQKGVSLSDLPQDSKICIEWQSTKKEEQVLVSQISPES